MKKLRLKLIYLLGALFLLLNLMSCSGPIQRVKSDFDGTETITMEPYNFLGFTYDKGSMSLLWDTSMPKDKSLAIFELNGAYDNDNLTSLNINIDGEKLKLKLNSVKKTSDIKTHTILMANKQSTNTKNKSKLQFLIPDKVILQLIKSKKSAFMINFANNEKFEEVAETSLKWRLAYFYEAKINAVK